MNEPNVRNGGISRRDFLKLLALVPTALALDKFLHPKSTEVKMTIDPETYFNSMGINFEHNLLNLKTKKLQIKNGSDANLDTKKIEDIYNYFENEVQEPFQYRLTNDSQEITVVPSRANWQEKGTVLIVPWSAGLPPQFSHLNNNNAFTDYSESGDHFTTIIRVPSEERAQKSGFSVPQSVQVSTVIEAAQTSVYVTTNGSTGLGLPPLEERLLTQEAFCNSYWYALYYRFLEYQHNPLLFAKTTFPSLPASDGKIYNLRSIFINKQQYDSLPTNPYLVPRVPKSLYASTDQQPFNKTGKKK